MGIPAVSRQRDRRAERWRVGTKCTFSPLEKASRMQASSHGFFINLTIRWSSLSYDEAYPCFEDVTSACGICLSMSFYDRRVPAQTLFCRRRTLPSRLPVLMRCETEPRQRCQSKYPRRRFQRPVLCFFAPARVQLGPWLSCSRDLASMLGDPELPQSLPARTGTGTSQQHESVLICRPAAQH